MQLVSLTVTLPDKAVPINWAVTFVAATSEDVFLTVMVPDAPLVVKVKGEPAVILIVGVEVGVVSLTFNAFAVLG